MRDASGTPVVTCFLRNRGEVLLLRRSDAVGSFSGKWGAVSGHVEEFDDPEAAAHGEIEEETGLGDVATLVRRGEPFRVEGDDRIWTVHPFLFDCDSRAVETNRETTEFEWMSPTDLYRRETVTDLRRSYDRVAPTVGSVAEDHEHGSAYVSLRALEVLRDGAARMAFGDEGDVNGDDGNGDDAERDWNAVADLARDLRDARPSMVALVNRANRAMHTAADERTPERVAETAHAGIGRALDADGAAAAEAADPLAGETVLTLSRSGTVLDALLDGNPEEVIVGESRPAREGVGVAETLADEDIDVTLCVDAAMAHVLPDRDVGLVLVGADTVLPDGSVVNKVGTRGTALAARHESVPVYAVAATDKIRPEPGPVDLEPGDSGEVYDGPADLAVANPTFDVTPHDAVTRVVTENGTFGREEVAAAAAELATLADWEE